MAKAQPKPEPKKVEETAKRMYVSQSDVPNHSLEEAIKVAQSIYDDYGGKATPPHQVAIALDISPAGKKWQNLAGASIAYGLTNGGCKSAVITVTDLGKRIVAPEEEGDDDFAKVDACLNPKIIKDFFLKYDKAKFPKDLIAKNVLVSQGVPKEKADEVYDIILANGNFVGLIQETKTGPFVYIDKSKLTPVEKTNGDSSTPVVTVEKDDDELPEELAAKLNFKKPVKEVTSETDFNVKPKVFISHGKNRKIVDQLKEILTFGQFEVVVSVDKESTAISVPEKVFSDMRDCNAAVIHVEGELELLDKDGNVHNTINQNVLIEIGAAMALYGKRFILLCESSLKLPSNLQGLYRCNYDGKELSYESTMKLLKAFNEFRQK
ncbi:MAG: nucleotide-binding protein [Verrucomicrobia bacterium]|nr:nucleotide-binding protein [Verrucomicrobiota bacterium]